jgi:hypothetical protein
VPDRRHHLVGHPGVQEPHQPAPGDHAQGGVPGIDQLPRGLHDVPQHDIQVIGAGYRQVGA